MLNKITEFNLSNEVTGIIKLKDKVHSEHVDKIQIASDKKNDSKLSNVETSVKQLYIKDSN